MNFEEFDTPYLETLQESLHIQAILNGYAEGVESGITESTAKRESAKLNAKLDDLIIKCNFHEDSLGVYEMLEEDQRRKYFNDAEEARGKTKLLLSIA